MIILGVETSCDETSVAVVKDGKEVLSNVVFSQIDIHQKYGGVVPEIASRHHIEKIIYVFDQAIKESNITFNDIDAIAVTVNPGLIGSLLVGYNAASALALAFNKELIEVDHIHGHIYANYLESDFEFPLLALVVSGGHTQLVLMKDHMEFEIIGETLDDAVGEAYDKVARVLGIGYPGGPIIDQLAKKGKPTYKLPIAWLDKDRYDFSFSGLKSAVTNLVNTHQMKQIVINHEDLAASFQESVITVLVEKTIKAIKEHHIKHVVIAGGVAANMGLREVMQQKINQLDGVKLTVPSLKYCTDNAAMIAVGGYFHKTRSKKE
jgi:N6-L-threonylcarbamoyladenine synthase